MIIRIRYTNRKQHPTKEFVQIFSNIGTIRFERIDLPKDCILPGGANKKRYAEDR